MTFSWTDRQHRALDLKPLCVYGLFTFVEHCTIEILKFYTEICNSELSGGTLISQRISWVFKAEYSEAVVSGCEAQTELGFKMGRGL